MDDTTKIPLQSQQTQQSLGDDNPPVQTVPLQQPSSVPTTPIGSKEGPPAPTLKVAEFVSASTPEVAVAPELKEMGVESHKEVPELPEIIENIGVKHAKESTPVTPMPVNTQHFPMTQTQAQQIIKKKKKITESILWLAMLVFKQWQMEDRKNKRPQKEGE